MTISLKDDLSEQPGSGGTGGKTRKGPLQDISHQLRYMPFRSNKQHRRVADGGKWNI